jgi:hypothetical protein
LICHPTVESVVAGAPAQRETVTMNAKVHHSAAPVISLQQYLSAQRTRTPRLVIDQTAPRSTYQPAYVAHRDVTTRRKAGAK